MQEAGSKRRGQPAPPHVIFQALINPDCDPARPWLFLLDDERPPAITPVSEPTQVTWSKLWRHRPDAIVRFDVAADGSGSSLRWTLILQEPLPGEDLLRHMRRRLGELINRDLRNTFDQ